MCFGGWRGGLERTLLFAFQCSIALTNSTIAAVFVMLAFADLEEECNVMIEHWQSIHSPCIKRCGVEGFVWLLGGIAACNVFKQRSPHYMIATPLIRPLQWKGMKRFFREVNIQWWLGFKSSLLCLVKPRFLRAWNRAMVFHRRLWRPWSLCSERVLISFINRVQFRFSWCACAKSICNSWICCTTPWI